MSTDVTAVAVLDASGAVTACGPGPAGAGLPAAADRLWSLASRAAGDDGPPEHVCVPVPGGAVAMVEAFGRRVVAVTGPRPAVALLLFDLRTCLGDAFADERTER